jgi:elongation factor P
MADTSDFRNGLTIIWNNDLWTIVDFQHVKPGKGGAFVRTKLRNVKTGRVNDNTFRSGERVETARVERRSYQFLYEDDLGLHFMNADTYEQTSLRPEMVSGRAFMKEGSSIDILVRAETEEPLTTEMPKTVELAVVETDPGLKGDTATGGSKPAKLESGATVNVPLFINEGDVIRVNVESGEYLTRVTMG